MRAVVQRVGCASVRVEGRVVGEIGVGLCVLVCAMAGDDEADAAFVARRICSLRIFPDPEQRMNLSVKDVGGGVLLVSQFTLSADTTSGARPSFSHAMEPAKGEHLYELTAKTIEAESVPVAKGTFRAKMELELVNDGPVTIIVDSRHKV